MSRYYETNYYTNFGAVYRVRKGVDSEGFQLTKYSRTINRTGVWTWKHAPLLTLPEGISLVPFDALAPIYQFMVLEATLSD